MVFRQSKLFNNVKPNSNFMQDIQNIKLDCHVIVAIYVLAGSVYIFNEFMGCVL